MGAGSGTGHTEAPDAGALSALSRAIQQSAVAVLIIEKSGEVRYANPRFCQLTGYDPDGLSLLNVFDLSARGEEEFIMWSVISTGNTWRGEIPGKRRNGEPFWASAFVTPVRDEQGEIDYYLSVFDEIAEPQPEFPVDVAPDIVLLIDPAGTILYTNRTPAGFSREEVTGDTVYSYVPASYHERLRGYIDLAMQTRRPVTYEIPSSGPHGTIDYYVSQVAPIERGGEVVALSIVTIDLSRRPVKREREEGSSRRQESSARGARSMAVESPELSKRESEVLELLVQGLTNRQVAERLKVSLRTIDHHVSHILAKLGVPNRTAAVLAARRSGLVGRR